MANRWLVSSGYPVGQLRRELDRVFTDAFGGFLDETPWLGVGPRSRGRSFPAVNLWETDEALYAEAEMPGLRMEDLEILVKGKELALKGERRDDAREGVTYHRRERAVGSFSGVVHLPVDIDVNKVEARLENGVLTIAMPKAPSARARKIEVKALSA